MTPIVAARVGVMAGWLLFMGSLALIARKGSAPAARRDRMSILPILLQGAAFALVWSRIPGQAMGFISEGIAGWLGAAAVTALAVASAFFALWALRTLGRQWSIVARLTDEHQLITAGPYGIVRHPIYSSMLGLVVATGPVFSGLLRTVMAIVLYLAGTFMRTRVEERLLTERFGQQYLAYRRRVPALLPRPGVLHSR